MNTWNVDSSLEVDITLSSVMEMEDNCVVNVEVSTAVSNDCGKFNFGSLFAMFAYIDTYEQSKPFFGRPTLLKTGK